MVKIIHFEEIDSTSTWARANLADLEDFTVVSADFQTKSYGQFERAWLSSAAGGGNCYISIVLKPENTAHLGDLTKFTSLQVVKTLVPYGLSPTMKYPNDVLVGGKKIAGILAESIYIGHTLKGVVVGVGVNLNLSADEAAQIQAPATSIFLETGKNVEKTEFIMKFLGIFKENYAEFLLHGLCPTTFS
jgi:BirA family biotin operon repressor/biotin-[acetyl-CoA-carboxylase] ligase